MDRRWGLKRLEEVPRSKVTRVGRRHNTGAIVYPLLGGETGMRAGYIGDTDAKKCGMDHIVEPCHNDLPRFYLYYTILKETTPLLAIPSNSPTRMDDDRHDVNCLDRYMINTG